MKKDLKVALLTLPILFLFFFVSVSYALNTNSITARVTVIAPQLEIRIIQPRNTTYYTKDDSKTLLLMFLIDKEPWRSLKSKYWMGYSLDDSSIIPINPGIFQGSFELKLHMKSLDDIPIGTHKLTVYVNDTSGNLGSSTVFFTIEKKSCKNFMIFEMFGICIPETTTTTTTTIQSTSTTISTTTIIGCSGKNFSTCNSLSNCKWVGDLRTGHCASK
jgi:hypothetical protein